MYFQLQMFVAGRDDHVGCHPQARGSSCRVVGSS
jgi:hypothetical protein